MALTWGCRFTFLRMLYIFIKCICHYNIEKMAPKTDPERLLVLFYSLTLYNCQKCLHCNSVSNEYLVNWRPAVSPGLSSIATQLVDLVKNLLVLSISHKYGTQYISVHMILGTSNGRVYFKGTWKKAGKGWSSTSLNNMAVSCMVKRREEGVKTQADWFVAAVGHLPMFA